MMNLPPGYDDWKTASPEDDRPLERGPQEPPTMEDYDLFGVESAHDGGWQACPECGYDKITAGDLFDVGEVEHENVFYLRTISFPIMGREPGSMNSVSLYVLYECFNCEFSGTCTMMGPRTPRDLVRKQMEFMRLDYKK